MAVVKTCDICNKLITDGDEMHRMCKMKIHYNLAEFDACKECSKKVVDFVFKLQEENEDDNAQSRGKKDISRFAMADL